VTVSNTDGDERIAACAKTGDRAAFEILVRRHKIGLYRFIRRYVGQTDDAYDVLQSAFVSAWTGLKHYDPGRPFVPWLRVIALNKCRDFARRQTVRRVILQAFANYSAAEPFTQLPDRERGEETIEAERLARLDRAIAELPAFYREPLLLTTVSGLSHQEVAVMLKTTPKAIEMRLYRARRRILGAMNSGTTEG
jgi:RNA polymerase sigma-70 factor (ECF subfamily)